MAQNVEYICDIVNCENKAKEKQKTMQVIFETEQTEGRASAPYFSNVKIELCEEHLEKALEGEYIHASGAQGHNRYYFKLRK